MKAKDIHAAMARDWNERAHEDPFLYTTTGANNDQYWASGEAMAEDLVRALGLTPTSRVLDYGCGVGRLAIPLSRRCNVTAVDISATMLKKARAAASARASGVVAFKRITKPPKVPVSDASVDAVVEVMALQHIPFAVMPKVLAEMVRVLKPRGFLIIKAASDDGDLLGRARDRDDDGNTWTARTYSLEEYEAILAPLGMAMVSTITFGDRTQVMFQKDVT